MASPLEDLLTVGSAAGEAIDRYTGGRALRGLLAGRPRELASVIPFSETLGLTKPGEQASGEDVLRNLGLPSSKLGGLAVDILANPLSLAGGIGAAAKAPTALKALGTFGKEVSGLGALESLGRGAASAGRGIKTFAMNPPEHPGLMNLLKGEGGWIKLPPRPESPGPQLTDWLAGVSRDYAQALQDPTTPAGKLQQLGSAVGVPIAQPTPGLHKLSEFYQKEFGPGWEALYEPGRRRIVPNVSYNPAEWLDYENMRAGLEQARAYDPHWYSSFDPNRTALHELGHALHHQALGPADPYALRTIDLSPEWTPTAQYVTRHGVGTYASKRPSEFVAERFLNNILAQAGVAPMPKLAQASQQYLTNLYNTLQGPQAPPQLLALLRGQP